MRARMALLHAGVQCELREVLLKNKPAAMLAASAKGTVPILQLPDARVLDESLDIMRWALANHNWLAVDDETLALIAYNDNDFKQHLDAYKYPQRFESESETESETEHHRDCFQAACVFLATLETRLAQSDFLYGDQVTLADIAIFPFVRQFAAVDMQAFAALPYRHVQSWLAQWLSDQHFQTIMRKYAVWQAGDEPVYLF